MTTTVAETTGYAALVTQGLNVAEQTAYVVMTSAVLSVASETAYVVMIDPAPHSGRRRQGCVIN